ncbi:MAG: LptF/LptG family permease [Actinobacteria bacterium]|nr:LptF/LptG family permease [Actinomycetota bacterium]
MFILWRYIIKEHINPFFFSISVISLVFLLNLVFRELGRILSRGLSFGLILEFFFLNMAWIIALAVPMAVLVATVMAFGRLSGDSEIIAMKAGGVSILHIIFPVFIVSILLNFFLVWFNNNVLPDFNHRTRLLATDIARKRPTINLEPGVLYRDLPNYNLMVQKVKEARDTSYVKTVFIEDNSDPNSNKIIFAKSGKIHFDQSTGYIYFTLYNGEIHELDLQKMEEYRKIHFPKYVMSISVPNMVLHRSDSKYRGDREKSAQMMQAEVDSNKKQIIKHKEKINQIFQEYFIKYLPYPESGLEFKALKGRDKKSIRSYYKKENNHRKLTLDRIKKELRQFRQRILAERHIINNFERANYSLTVEVQKKYSIPFACIVFVLIGAPLGIMSRKGNLAVAGGISFGFFLLYWISLIGGEELADNQLITPFMAMWLANIVVGAGGVYLVIYSIHEATFINWTAMGDFIGKLFKKK